MAKPAEADSGGWHIAVTSLQREGGVRDGARGEEVSLPVAVATVAVGAAERQAEASPLRRARARVIATEPREGQGMNESLSPGCLQTSRRKGARGGSGRRGSRQTLLRRRLFSGGGARSLRSLAWASEPSLLRLLLPANSRDPSEADVQQASPMAAGGR